jgi:hypothetical protein
LIALPFVLLVFLLAHLCHLRSAEPTGLRERWHTEVVKINEDDYINVFWLLRSSLSAMTFYSAMNQQMTVYRYVPWRVHEHKRRLCEGRGDHRDNEGITKMGSSGKPGKLELVTDLVVI